MGLTLLNISSSFGRLSLLSCDLCFGVVAGLDDNITSTLGCLSLLRLFDIRILNSC
jgi:hypothetical protein